MYLNWRPFAQANGEKSHKEVTEARKIYAYLMTSLRRTTPQLKNRHPITSFRAAGLKPRPVLLAQIMGFAPVNGLPIGVTDHSEPY